MLGPVQNAEHSQHPLKCTAEQRVRGRGEDQDWTSRGGCHKSGVGWAGRIVREGPSWPQACLTAKALLKKESLKEGIYFMSVH